jgi:hypothetical protein
MKESSVSGGLAVGWAACCFVLSIFPLLSVEFGSSISLVYAPLRVAQHSVRVDSEPWRLTHAPMGDVRSAGGLVAFALGALPFVVKLFFTPRPAPVVVGGKEKEEKSERNKVAYLPPFSPAEARMAAIQVPPFACALRTAGHACVARDRDCHTAGRRACGRVGSEQHQLQPREQAARSILQPRDRLAVPGYSLGASRFSILVYTLLTRRTLCRRATSVARGASIRIQHAPQRVPLQPVPVPGRAFHIPQHFVRPSSLSL